MSGLLVTVCIRLLHYTKRRIATTLADVKSCWGPTRGGLKGGGCSWVVWTWHRTSWRLWWWYYLTSALFVGQLFIIDLLRMIRITEVTQQEAAKEGRCFMHTIYVSMNCYVVSVRRDHVALPWFLLSLPFTLLHFPLSIVVSPFSLRPYLATLSSVRPLKKSACIVIGVSVLLVSISEWSNERTH